MNAPWDTIGSRTHAKHVEQIVGVGFKFAIFFDRLIVYSVANSTRQNDERSSPSETFTGLKICINLF